MKKTLRTAIVSIMVCMTVIWGFSASVFAAVITPSQNEINMEKVSTEFTFEIQLKSDTDFAGAEFGLKPSNSDVTLKKLTFLDEADKSSKVQTVKDGILYFGFFGDSNKYKKGNYNVARVTYEYKGSGTRTVDLVSSKIVTIDEEFKTTYGDTSSAPFTVTVKRVSDNEGGGVGTSPGGDVSGDIKDDENPGEDEPAVIPNFTDIDGHWAKSNILKAVELGLFSGTSDTTFSPDDSVTRAMAVTVLGRMADVPSAGYHADFIDVAEEDYFYSYVGWGFEKGIVKGLSDTEFAPDQFVTREQMAAFIVRYAKAYNINLPTKTESIKSHSDYGLISEWAVDDMTVCYDMKLISGRDSGELNPQGTLTRAEFASIMVRFIDYCK